MKMSLQIIYHLRYPCRMLSFRNRKNPNHILTHRPQIPKEPPFPERLLIEKPVIQSEFDIMTEVKNVCVKIPLLQAIKDVPIYAKTIKELCIKKPGQKQKDPPTIHLVGQLSNYISETPKIVKYANPGNPIVSVTINNVSIGNTLVDLGAAINIMTSNTVELLQLEQVSAPYSYST
jgi:hypothetical protein